MFTERTDTGDHLKYVYGTFLTEFMHIVYRTYEVK